MTNSLEEDLIRFAHTLEERHDRAHDLWTWLPSCKEAQKCLGDYYTEVMPDMAYIMVEACSYISDLRKGYDPTNVEYENCPKLKGKEP